MVLRYEFGVGHVMTSGLSLDMGMYPVCMVYVVVFGICLVMTYYAYIWKYYCMKHLQWFEADVIKTKGKNQQLTGTGNLRLRRIKLKFHIPGSLSVPSSSVDFWFQGK